MFNNDIDFIVNSNEILTPTYTAGTGIIDLYGIPIGKTKIKNISKRPYAAPVSAGVQVPISDTKWDAESYYQIRIEVVANEFYQDGSFIGREQGYGKPFIVEFKTPAADVADYSASLISLIKDRFNSMPLIWQLNSGIVTGTDPNKLLHVKFVNEYFNIKIGTISKLNIDTLKWTEVGSIVKSSDSSMIQIQGFGTYDYIIRNLRIPSYEAMRLYAIAIDKRPILTDQYTQYTIETEVKRNFSGDSVVGEDLVSNLRHIYYVDTSKKTIFESMFNAGNANIPITTI